MEGFNFEVESFYLFFLIHFSLLSDEPMSKNRSSQSLLTSNLLEELQLMTS